MEMMLKKKVDAVEKLVETAEESYVDHVYNKDIQLEYFNANLINKDNSEEFQLVESEHFATRVNFTHSTIQVPINVYNKEPSVLNGINFTNCMDAVFLDNYENDPTLTWQYFGSHTGFFRNYPGIEWSADEEIDLYDTRHRIWYLQAAHSPKDVVVLLDVSGSMTGQRLAIAKYTVQVIMDTLGDNDFFNVLTFNDQPVYVESCFNSTLVQANSENKEKVKVALGEISAEKIADFDRVLEEAFILLQSFNETGRGSSCNQAIMLITDGAVSNSRRIFQKFNWPHKKVRMFTYVIGRDISAQEPLQWMACNNKGYFNHISTLADVKQNVMNYIHVLSRPMVIERRHHTTWTNVYMDTGSSEGLKLVSTVSKPVFDKNNLTHDKGILLGVVGVDVPIFEMYKTTPSYRLGVNGYTFAVTNNGYILYHPDLRPEYDDCDGNRREKPNYNSVDLSEVELGDNNELLRTAMIDKKTGNLTLKVTTHREFTRVVEKEMHYYYTYLENTPFSLGVALSTVYGLTNISVTTPVAGHSDWIDMLEALQDTNIILAPCDLMDCTLYCQMKFDPGEIMTQMEAIIGYVRKVKLDGKDVVYSCNEDIISSVLFDAKITRILEDHWSTLPQRGFVNVAYVGTVNGLTRFYNFANMNDTLPGFLKSIEKYVNSEYFVSATNIWETTQNDHSFAYSVPFHTGSNLVDDTVVIASKVVTVTDRSYTAITAAVGIQIPYQIFDEIFYNATISPYEGLVMPTCKHALNTNAAILDCYVLDYNGYVIISQFFINVGKFFGEINGKVMHDLLQNGIFVKKIVRDNQAMCKLENTVNDSGASNISLLTTLLTVTGYIQWWMKQFVLLLLNLCVYTWFQEGPGIGVTAQWWRSLPAYEVCHTDNDLYMLGNNVRALTGYVDCPDSYPVGGCQPTYGISPILNSNLLLLVIDSTCFCTNNPPLTMERRKIEGDGCQNLNIQKYRRRPEYCHNYNRYEDAEDCNGNTGQKLSITYLITIVVSQVMIAHVIIL